MTAEGVRTIAATRTIGATRVDGTPRTGEGAGPSRSVEARRALCLPLARPLRPPRAPSRHGAFGYDRAAFGYDRAAFGYDAEGLLVCGPLVIDHGGRRVWAGGRTLHLDEMERWRVEGAVLELYAVGESEGPAAVAGMGTRAQARRAGALLGALPGALPGGLRAGGRAFGDGLGNGLAVPAYRGWRPGASPHAAALVVFGGVLPALATALGGAVGLSVAAAALTGSAALLLPAAMAGLVAGPALGWAMAWAATTALKRLWCLAIGRRLRESDVPFADVEPWRLERARDEQRLLPAAWRHRSAASAHLVGAVPAWRAGRGNPGQDSQRLRRL